MLKTTASELHKLIASSPEAMIIVDSKGMIVRSNKALEKLFGYKAGELTNAELDTLLPERFRKKHVKYRENFFSEAEIRPMSTGLDLYGCQKDGTEFPVEISLHPFETEDGTLVYATIRDVTDHRRAEEELRNNTNFFRLLGRAAEHANSAANFEEAIQSFLTDVCMFNGWPVGHAYVRAPDGADRLVPTRIWYMHEPDRFAKFREVTETTEFEPGIGLPGRVMVSGKPAWITDVTKDANFPRAKLADDIGVRAGFAIPVLVGSDVVAVLEFFATQAVDPDDSLLVTLMQIGSQLGRVAERSRAENALYESQELLETILDNVPAHIFLRDLEGRFLLINARYAKRYGLSKGHTLGKKIHDILPKESADLASETDRDVIREGRPIENETLIPTEDGDRIFASVKFPIFDSNNQMTSIGGIAFEITERKRAERERLRQSQKMDVLGQLTGSVAHDFNNLLTVLDCNISVLKSQKIGQERQQSLIKDCIAAVELGSSLTSRLTKFARKEPLAETIVDLNTLIGGFSDLLERSIGEDVSFEFVLSGVTLPVLVDTALLEVALLNLAINARDAMPEGGMITVSLSKAIIDGKVESIYGKVEQRPYALLQVSDTGIGMAPEILERVFEAFFTTKDEGKGTGLGLSTVRDLAQSSGGFVQIESEPGKGTTVKLYLPLSEK